MAHHSTIYYANMNSGMFIITWMSWTHQHIKMCQLVEVQAMRKSIGTKKIDNNSKPDWCGRLLMVGKKVMLMIGLNKN